MTTQTNETTRRDTFEQELAEEFPAIVRFHPKLVGSTIERYKDGSFGFSNLAFALYSNGHNLRGESPESPLGRISLQEQAVFSLGYFQKENDSPDSPGYLVITSPRGSKALDTIREITDFVLTAPHMARQCQGVYTRFLSLEQYIELLNSGFLPIKESPWHPESPEEDETLTNSIVNTAEVRSGRKIQNAYKRFNNFLERNNVNYNLRSLSEKDVQPAREIIREHFRMLKEQGKGIGSTPEDHYNSLDPAILSLKGVDAFIGHLEGKPVSVFVGEQLTKERLGLYTGVTLREPEILETIPQIKDIRGFTAMPTYAYACLFRELQKRGFKEAHLGGSEIPDLNRFKRQLGARSDPSYWAVKLKT